MPMVDSIAVGNIVIRKFEQLPSKTGCQLVVATIGRTFAPTWQLREPKVTFVRQGDRWSTSKEWLEQLLILSARKREGAYMCIRFEVEVKTLTDLGVPVRFPRKGAP